MAEKRPALGRGLSALIPDAPAAGAPPASAPLDVDIDLLRPNQFQPRTSHGRRRASTSSPRSIRANGVIQPIVVRKVDDGYEIVAGERRWRASQRAGLLKVPVVVRDIPDDRLLAAALIENIQREDLNPIEEAHAYRRLADEYRPDAGTDRRVGRQGPLVGRQLPAAAEAAAGGPRATSAPARCRWATPARCSACRTKPRSCASSRDVLTKGLSVRETEALVRKAMQPAAAKAAARKDVHTRAAEERLRFALGTRVRIVRKGKGGRIEIDFGSEDELQRLFEQLTGDK